MTGKDLFVTALDICGLHRAEYDLPTDIEDLEKRALSLINLLLAENSILDSRIRKNEHRLLSISSLDDNLSCSQIIAQSVLPYGLARLMMLGEDDALADRFWKIYEESKKNALSFGQPKAHPITEVYK